MKENDKDRLYEWIKKYFKRYIKTSDIIKWGAEHYSNRADRNARDLRKEGKLRRLTKAEMILSGFDTTEGIYEII
jgi:5'(3')-deoxyribonucleotidase